MPDDFDQYVAYRLSTDPQRGRMRSGCSPLLLFFILAVVVVIGLAALH